MLLAVLVGIQAGGTEAGRSDPRVGAWTLVSAQSTMEPANRLSITSVTNGTHVVLSGETHVDFTANMNGHEAAAPGNFGFNQIELHRMGKHQVEVREKKDGVLVATVREALSNDGSELTSTNTVVGHPAQITVWTRTGGAKDAKDPFAGDWTQDLSKSRMRQGLQVKIEAVGGGSVRFVGDYSYTARFDGKPYDVKDSRNDTVALGLVDAHTVDATFRRDSQVTQKDRWQVSADGKQMTLVSAATLETGQRVNERLVFKKQ